MKKESSSDTVCKEVCGVHGHNISIFEGVLICTKCGKTKDEIKEKER